MFSLELDGLKQVMQQLKTLENVTKKDIKDEFNKIGLEIVNDAKRLAPVDEGALIRNSISYKLNGYELEITASAAYAAYVEFGTRKYAASYVSSLPPDWQAFAGKFKGKTNSGDLYNFFLRIVDWIKRKGIKSGRYSIRTRRRLGNKTKKFEEDLKTAESIAYAILKNGIKPQPYLYPAVTNNVPKLVPRLKRLYERRK